MHFDGACRGNPGGKSAGAAVLFFHDPDGRLASTLTAHGKVFHGTNNEAEWQGLLAGLHQALKVGVKHLTIRGDSKLVVEQVRGNWRVKTEHLKPLHGEAMALLENFDSWQISWVPREHNSIADRASNEAIDHPRRFA